LAAAAEGGWAAACWLLPATGSCGPFGVLVVWTVLTWPSGWPSAHHTVIVESELRFRNVIETVVSGPRRGGWGTEYPDAGDHESRYARPPLQVATVLPPGEVKVRVAGWLMVGCGG
jgi:hypothetical protein